MTRDPFDRLRDQNPVPTDRLPEPPMSLADRITAGRRHAVRAWPGWAVAATAAVLVAAVGGAWMLWLGSGDDSITAAPPTTAASPDTTTDGASTTTPAETTAATQVTTTGGASTTTLPAPVGSGVVYLFVSDPTSYTGGPFLIPAERTFAVLSAPVTDPLATTLAFLLVGPTPGETEGTPSVTTAIPEGTVLNGVEVFDGIAHIDLSSQFTTGGGTLSMTGRVAQLVFTATRYPDVDGIRILIDGEPLSVLGGEGIILDDPITRDGFDDLLPAVLIEAPATWGNAGNPLEASGTANVFEATVSVALTDAEGLILWEGFTTATCGTGCRGTWEITIPYAVDEAQLGSLLAWEASPEDGRPTNVREHAVWLSPLNTPATTVPGTEPDVTTGTTLVSGPWTVAEQWTETDTGVSRIHVAWPLVDGPDTDVVEAVSSEIDVVVVAALDSFAETEAAATSEGEYPNEFGLGYEVTWLTSRYLSILFDEYYGISTAAHPHADRFALLFDLSTGGVLRTGDLVTPEGSALLGRRVESAVDELTGDSSLCCDTDPSTDAALLPGGLLIVLDELDGLPHALGAVEVFIPWSDLDGLLTETGAAVRASTPACSAEGLQPPGPQDGLPEAVAAMRAAIGAAAVACDWSGLTALTDEGFTATFGGGVDPAAYWARLEGRGLDPLLYLAELLDRPYATLDAGEYRYYVWPSAAAPAWEDVTEPEREALRPLYGEDDFAGFAEFGAYIGLRIGITEDGRWVFFVSGD